MVCGQSWRRTSARIFIAICRQRAAYCCPPVAAAADSPRLLPLVALSALRVAPPGAKREGELYPPLSRASRPATPPLTKGGYNSYRPPCKPVPSVCRPAAQRFRGKRGYCCAAGFPCSSSPGAPLPFLCGERAGFGRRGAPGDFFLRLIFAFMPRRAGRFSPASLPSPPPPLGAPGRRVADLGVPASAM